LKDYILFVCLSTNLHLASVCVILLGKELSSQLH
jgi:hypothetical protein